MKFKENSERIDIQPEGYALCQGGCGWLAGHTCPLNPTTKHHVPSLHPKTQYKQQLFLLKSQDHHTYIYIYI